MNKLRVFRLNAGLSQMELAAASNVVRWKIQLAESGLRSLTPEERDSLCEALGVPLETLFPSNTIEFKSC